MGPALGVDASEAAGFLGVFGERLMRREMKVALDWQSELAT